MNQSTCKNFAFPSLWCIYITIGVYIGYTNKERYRVWVTGDADHFRAIEKRASSYTAMGVELLTFVFKSELKNAKAFCCTPSKDREVLNPVKLQGIRCKGQE